MVGYYSFSYTVSHCKSELFTELSTFCASRTPTAETAAVWGSHPSFIRCYSLVAALGVGVGEAGRGGESWGDKYLLHWFWGPPRVLQQHLHAWMTSRQRYPGDTHDALNVSNHFPSKHHRLHYCTDLNFSTLIILLLKFHRCLFFFFNFQTWPLHYYHYCNGYINSSIKNMYYCNLAFPF